MLVRLIIVSDLELWATEKVSSLPNPRGFYLLDGQFKKLKKRLIAYKFKNWKTWLEQGTVWNITLERVHYMKQCIVTTCDSNSLDANAGELPDPWLACYHTRWAAKCAVGDSKRNKDGKSLQTCNVETSLESRSGVAFSRGPLGVQSLDGVIIVIATRKELPEICSRIENN